MADKPNQTIVVRDLTNREFLERYAQPGCIGLSGGVTLIDKAICRAERHLDAQARWGAWSHAFVFEGRRVDGHHWVIESDLQIQHKHIQLGVQENRVTKYFDEKLYTTLAVLDFGLTAEQLAVLLGEGLELVANRERYSLRELVGTLIALKRPELRGQENQLARERSLFCSAFVNHLYRKAGLDLAPGVHSKNTTPEDFARTVVPHTMYVLQHERLRSKLLIRICFLAPAGTERCAGDLAGGDEIDLFDAPAFNSSSSFSATNLPALDSGMNWWGGNLVSNGTLVVNLPPVAGPNTAGAVQGQTITIPVVKLLANDTGEAGETLSITGVGNPTSGGGTASVGGGNVTYTAPGSGTSDAISYTLSDGRGGTATGTITVSLTSANAGSLNIVSGPVVENNNFKVGFAGIPGYTYSVQDSTNSPTGPWAYLTNLTAGTNGLFNLIVTNDPPAVQRYFRTLYP